MNTSGLFSGTSNPDSQSDAGTPDSGADVPPMITADGSGNEHDDSEGGDERADGENVMGGDCFLYINDNNDEGENEPSLLPGEDDPMRHLFGGDTLDEDQGNNT